MRGGAVGATGTRRMSLLVLSAFDRGRVHLAMSGRHEHGTTQLSIPRMARGFSLAMSRQCTRFTEGGLCNAHRQCGIKQQAFMFAGNWSRRVVLAVGLFSGLVARP